MGVNGVQMLLQIMFLRKTLETNLASKRLLKTIVKTCQKSLSNFLKESHTNNQKKKTKKNK